MTWRGCDGDAFFSWRGGGCEAGMWDGVWSEEGCEAVRRAGRCGMQAGRAIEGEQDHGGPCLSSLIVRLFHCMAGNKCMSHCYAPSFLRPASPGCSSPSLQMEDEARQGGFVWQRCTKRIGATATARTRRTCFHRGRRAGERSRLDLSEKEDSAREGECKTSTKGESGLTC